MSTRIVERPIEACRVRVGDKVQGPNGGSFFEITEVRRGQHDAHFGWPGGDGVKLSTGWGSLTLKPDEIVHIKVAVDIVLAAATDLHRELEETPLPPTESNAYPSVQWTEDDHYNAGRRAGLEFAIEALTNPSWERG